MDPTAQEFVERMGVIMSGDGMPRIAGRILGLLLLTPGEVSLDDIAEQLDVSKASVSLDARRLEQRGVIERVSRPGDRRDYYRIADDVLTTMMQRRMERWRTIHDTVVAARDSIPGLAPEVFRRLDEFAAGSDLIFANIRRNLARWADERGRFAALASSEPAAESNDT